MRVWLMDTSHNALEPRLCAGLNNTVRQVRGLLHIAQRAVEIEVAEHRAQMRERRRLSKQLEREPMPGVVRIQQVACEGEQLAAGVGGPRFIYAVRAFAAIAHS